MSNTDISFADRGSVFRLIGTLHPPIGTPAGYVLTSRADGGSDFEPGGGGSTTHELLVTDGIVNPPETVWNNPNGDDWVYADA